MPVAPRKITPLCRVAVREEDRTARFRRLDAHPIARHDIRPVEKVSYASKSFGFTLGAIDAFGHIEPAELGVLLGIAEGDEIEGERALGDSRNNELFRVHRVLVGIEF